MKSYLGIGLAMIIAGCASTGVVPTGDGTYMIAKKSAAGIATSGSTIKAELYQEAGEFCGKSGRVVQTISATSANAIPFARMPQAELNFRCATPSAEAASATQ